MKLTIKKIGINGEGIAYFNKKPVFINKALVDEEVECKLIENNNTYYKGECIKIYSESSLREKPACKFYKDCAACKLQHTSYENQLEIKKQLLIESMAKYANIEVNPNIIPSSKIFNYRNSLKLPFSMNNGKLINGLYDEDSNSVIFIDTCLIHDELLEEVRIKVLDILNKYKLKAYDRKRKLGLKYLYMRALGKRIQMCITTGNDKLDVNLINELSDIKEIVSIYQSVNTHNNDIFGKQMIHLYGGKQLNYKYDDLSIKLSIKSFYQLNTLQTKKLYSKVVELLPKENNLIVEGYCGIGIMSMLASKYANKVIGIEYIKEAIVNASKIAQLNKIENTSFVSGDFKDELVKIKESIDTLIVDPPRSGLDDKVIDTIMNKNIKNIIYVSCNPATLAKNINVLKTKYNIEHIECLDMFPQTSHVETIVLLKHKPLTYKTKIIPQADIEMMREDLYEEKMYRD